MFHYIFSLMKYVSSVQIYGMFYYGIIDHNFENCYKDMAKLVPHLDMNDFIHEDSIYDLPKEDEPMPERQQFLESDEFERNVTVESGSDDEADEIVEEEEDDTLEEEPIEGTLGAGFDEETLGIETLPTTPQPDTRSSSLAHSELNSSPLSRHSSPRETRFRQQNSILGRRLVQEFGSEQQAQIRVGGSTSKDVDMEEEENVEGGADEGVPDDVVEGNRGGESSVKTVTETPLVLLSDSDDDGSDEDPSNSEARVVARAPVVHPAVVSTAVVHPVVVRQELVPDDGEEVFNAAGKAPHPAAPVSKRDVDWFEYNQEKRKKKEEKREREAEATRLIVEEARLAKERAESLLKIQEEKDRERDREMRERDKEMQEMRLMLLQMRGQIIAPIQETAIVKPTVMPCSDAVESPKGKD